MESIKDNIFTLRFRSDKSLEPIAMYSYLLDLSQADKDVEVSIFLNSICRKLNKMNYHAVWHDGYIYTLVPINPNLYTHNIPINNKPNYLTLKYEKHDSVPLCKKEIYEKILLILIERNLLGIRKRDINLYFKFDYKIASEYIPFFNNDNTYKGGILKKINNELYHLARVYNIKPFLNADGYFDAEISIHTKIISNISILELHRRRNKIEGLIAKPSKFISSLGGFDTTGAVTMILDNKELEFNTVSGLLQYYKERYNVVLPTFNDDFVVHLVKDSGKRTSYLASTIFPIYDFQTIKRFDNKGVMEVHPNLKIDMKRRMYEASLLIEQIGTIPELHNVGFYKTNLNNVLCVIPQAASNCGFEFSIIPEPALLIGENKNIIINTNNKSQIFKQGVHRKPKIMRDNKTVKILAISMTKYQISEDILLQIATNIINNSIGHLYSMEKIALFYDCYDHKKEASEVSFAKRIKKEYDADIIIGVIDDNNVQYNFGDMEYDEYTEMKEAFAENSIAIPSQMITYKTFRQYQNNSSSIPFISNNICLGILGKLGGMAFTLKDNYKNIDLYVGLDVGATKQNTRVPCCAAAFMGNGDFIGVMAPRDFTNGEIIPNEILKKLFDRLIAQYNEVYKKIPQRVVIHRDGFFTKIRHGLKDTSKN